MLDWRGTEIKVGSRVVWPGRHSSSMWMSEGTVTFLDEKHVEKSGGAHWWERKIHVKNDKGHTVVPAFERVTVIG